MDDDRFLESMRREPRAEFARDLEQRLRANDARDARRAGVIESGLPRMTPRFALAGVALTAVVVSLFLFPSVRASAQSILDLFRVRNFAAVPFDPARLERLHELKGSDQQLLLFDKVEMVEEPGAPMILATPQAGAPTMGYMPVTPTFLPRDLKIDKIEMRAEAETRLTVSTAKLQSLLETLDVRDLKVPSSIDGKVIDVRIQPVLRQSFKNGDLKAEFVQSRSPEVDLPPGADLAQLGEIGLRILGLEANEARRFAHATDWRTTLVVPVPVNATQFREVTVRGQRGLFVNSQPADGSSKKRRGGGVVMWADGERVFALSGNLTDQSLMEMAESVQ